MTKKQKTPPTIASYSHPNPEPPSEPANPAPGYYYVSVLDGERYGLLLGPFQQHADAIAMVPAVNAWVSERYSESAFWAFGTCGVTDKTHGLNAHLVRDCLKAGKLNVFFSDAPILEIL